MAGKIDCFGLSDQGPGRPENQDQFLIADLSKSMYVHTTSLSFDDHARLFGNTQGTLLLVADGMGEHFGGGEASRLAVETIGQYVLNAMRWFPRSRNESDADFRAGLMRGFEMCQQQLYERMAAQPECNGMGTTLTLAFVNWPQAYVVHVGDSRCYRLRGGQLERITQDHTMAQQAVARGVMTADNVPARWKHTLWNVVGGHHESLEPDYFELELELGDKLLLCTDGLVEAVDDGRIQSLLQTEQPAEELCQQLLKRARDQGAQDDVTVVAAQFCDLDDPPVAAAMERATTPVSRQSDAASESAVDSATTTTLETDRIPVNPEPSPLAETLLWIDH